MYTSLQAEVSLATVQQTIAVLCVINAEVVTETRVVCADLVSSSWWLCVMRLLCYAGAASLVEDELTHFFNHLRLDLQGAEFTFMSLGVIPGLGYAIRLASDEYITAVCCIIDRLCLPSCCCLTSCILAAGASILPA